MVRPPKCFAHFTDKDLKEKSININTIKNEEKAERALKQFLQETGAENTDFYQYTKSELDHGWFKSDVVHAF